MIKNALLSILLIGVCAIYYGCNKDSCETMGFIDEFEQQSIDFFDEIVMTNESDGTKRPLRRWESPMKIYLNHDLPEYLDSSLVHVLDTLNSLMSVSGVEIVNAQFQSNVDLFFTTVDEYNSLNSFADPIPQSYNGYVKIWSTESTIQRARMFVSSGLSEVFTTHVLYEEITQGLGPLTDTPNNTNTIFSTTFPSFADQPELFPLDKELIKNLYSEHLQKGMTDIQVQASLEKYYLCN